MLKSVGFFFQSTLWEEKIFIEKLTKAEFLQTTFSGKTAERENKFALILEFMGKAEDGQAKDFLKELADNQSATCKGQHCAFGMFSIG